MKFFAVLAAAAVAVVSAQDAPCDTAKLAPLLQDASLKGCHAESGLTFPPTAVPTAEQIKKACVKDCGALISKVQATGLTTCKLGAVDLIKDMLDPIAKECKFDAAPAKNETVAVVSAEDAPCDTAKLAPLLQDALLKGCHAESGLTFPPTAVPTAEQIKKACVKDCGALISKVQATGLTTCKLGAVDLIKDMLDPIAKECKFDAAAAPAKNETASPEKSSSAPTATSARNPDTISEGNSKSVWLVIAPVLGSALVVTFLVWKTGQRRRRANNDVEREPEHLSDSHLATELLAKTNMTHDSSTQQTTSGVMESLSHSEGRDTYRRAFQVAAASALMDPQVLQARISLSDLLLGDKIGHGAYGEVFVGEYRSVPVAIKRLSPQHRHDIKLLESFLNEAKLTASLQHPRIIHFVGIAWDTSSDVHVVTEYMSGGDLRSLLSMYRQQRRPTGFDQHKLRIALNIVEALSYLHARQPQVLHRDLKSRNVLLSTQHEAKLIDFGVSRERADSTMTAGVGTLRWMAPEVMRGGRYSDMADIFSFGVVLSELDTHRIPYSVDGAPSNDLAIITQVAMGQLSVEFSTDADEKIVELAQMCMAFEVSARPTASHVESILKSFLSQEIAALELRLARKKLKLLLKKDQVRRRCAATRYDSSSSDSENASSDEDESSMVFSKKGRQGVSTPTVSDFLEATRNVGELTSDDSNNLVKTIPAAVETVKSLAPIGSYIGFKIHELSARAVQHASRVAPTEQVELNADPRDPQHPVN
ncbi:hypothetical protein ATCC90586_000650 [Pythium insidiosum]|nr:hypothetical protein ATCC90586_000650 [Pythium insidiosum]